MKSIYYSLFILCLVLISCDPKRKDDDNIPIVNDAAPWVVCQGNYTGGNSSLHLLDGRAGSGIDRYKEANGLPLGDVAQSGIRVGGSLYIIVNNSGKIEVLDEKTAKSNGVIRNLPSPRYIQTYPEGNLQKAYVSDLYGGGLSIVNLLNKTITGKVAYRPSPVADSFGTWTEEMLLSNNKIFVCAVKSGSILVLDPLTDKWIDTIQVGVDPLALVEDGEGKIWVLCSGNLAGDGSPASIWRLDPKTHKVLTSWVLGDMNSAPGSMATKGDRTIMYYTDRGLYSFPISATNTGGVTQLVAQPSGSAGFNGVDGFTQNGEEMLYLSDPRRYVTNGFVYSYTLSGLAKDTFPVGRIPGNMF